MGRSDQAKKELMIPEIIKKHFHLFEIDPSIPRPSEMALSVAVQITQDKYLPIEEKKVA